MFFYYLVIKLKFYIKIFIYSHKIELIINKNYIFSNSINFSFAFFIIISGKPDNEATDIP